MGGSLQVSPQYRYALWPLLFGTKTTPRRSPVFQSGYADKPGEQWLLTGLNGLSPTLPLGTIKQNTRSASSLPSPYKGPWICCVGRTRQPHASPLPYISAQIYLAHCLLRLGNFQSTSQGRHQVAGEWNKCSGNPQARSLVWCHLSPGLESQSTLRGPGIN